MKKLFSILSNSINYISCTISAVGISAGVGLAFANVIARYGFNYSITWASELTMYLFLWSMFFAVTYGFKLDTHITIGIVIEKVNKKNAKIMMIITKIISIIFLSIVAYYGYEYLLLVIDLDETSVDLDIPMWIPYLVIPLSFAFSAYVVIENLIKLINTPLQDLKFKNETDELLEETNLKNILQKVKKKSGGLV
jgi:C4-dicarboxylate transporter DctQ subunit